MSLTSLGSCTSWRWAAKMAPYCCPSRAAASFSWPAISVTAAASAALETRQFGIDGVDAHEPLGNAEIFGPEHQGRADGHSGGDGDSASNFHQFSVNLAPISWRRSVRNFVRTDEAIASSASAGIVAAHLQASSTVPCSAASVNRSSMFLPSTVRSPFRIQQLAVEPLRQLHNLRERPQMQAVLQVDDDFPRARRNRIHSDGAPRGGGQAA